MLSTRGQFGTIKPLQPQISFYFAVLRDPQLGNDVPASVCPESLLNVTDKILFSQLYQFRER